MTSFFALITQPYDTVPIEGGINTEKFLAATEDLIKLFDFLNSTAFAPVKSDMNGNIKKIRDKYVTNTEKFSTLQALVEDETKAGQKRTATEGLMWLRRGLQFTSLALRRNLDNPAEELNVSFTKSYEVTLKQHHNMFIRPVFTLAMSAVPYRKDFYKKLSGGDETEAVEKMKPWLSGLEKCVQILVDFYKDNKYES